MIATDWYHWLPVNHYQDSLGTGFGSCGRVGGAMLNDRRHRFIALIVECRMVAMDVGCDRAD